MATINISLPKGMYDDAKKIIKEKHYSSMSELIRDALRKTMYANLTENGFTEEFEEEVLRSAKEPDEGETWKTEKDIHRFFQNLRKELNNNA